MEEEEEEEEEEKEAEEKEAEAEESLERERAEEGRTFADLEPAEDEMAERTFDQDENDPYSDAEVEVED